MLDKFGVVVKRHVKRRAVGTFTLPGLPKIKVVRKPATKARKMIALHRPAIAIEVPQIPFRWNFTWAWASVWIDLRG